MSWLYTLVFTGLLFSGQATTVRVADSDAADQAAAVQTTAAEETERFEQTYPLNADGRVNVSNVNGSITVEAWDRNEVKLEYTKIADSKEHLADVEVKIEARADRFSVEADYDSWKGRNAGDKWRNGKLSIEFKLKVPRGAVLKDIETVNGSVMVSNFTNVTRVSAVNGTVTAANIRGSASISTVNGEVVADFERLENGTKVSLETVNGRVNLSIPSDSNATLRAESLNGNITNDFGLPVVKGKYVGRDLYGKIGSGDTQIRLESVNGALSIKRKNDGRNVAPSVNLLPNKEKDEEDWDDENSMISVSKADKEIARAAKARAKEAANVSAKALAAAEIELKQIQPELARISAESAAVAAKTVAETARIMSSDELKQKMKDVESRQKEAMARIADAFYFPTVPSVESKSETFAVKGTPKVKVEAAGCSVTVRGWDRSEVQYRVIQFSDPRNRKPINITDKHGDSSVELTIVNPDESARNGDFSNDRSRVRVEVFVPRKTNLKIRSNGEIRVDGVSGEAELIGANEAVNVRDGDGKLKIANEDGRVRVIGFNGELDTTTANGDIFLEGDFSKITGVSDTGNFFLTVPDSPNVDILANVDELTNETALLPKAVSERHWRFGSGGPDYSFRVADGRIVVRSTASITN